MGHAGWLPDPHITKYVDVCERSAEICQNAAQYVETTITGTTNSVTKLEERVDEATATIDTAVAEARALVPQIEEGIEIVHGYVTEAESIKEDIDTTHDEIDIAAGVIAESVTNAQGYATAASTSASASAQSATSASDSADDAEDSATTATSAATSASTSATNAASSAATAQSLVDSIPSNVADAIVQEDIPGKVHNYLEDEHISADFEFDTFADYEDAWAAGIVKAGDNIYIKSDERFLYASVDDIVRCTVGDVNDYDNTVLYTVGDYCLYKHRLWMCKIESRAVTPVEGAVWSLISLSELKQSIDNKVKHTINDNTSTFYQETILFSNGTKIINQKYTTDLEMTRASGPAYYGRFYTSNFNTENPFISVPTVQISSESSDYGGNAIVTGVGNSSLTKPCDVYGFRFTSSTEKLVIKITAIGRWK